jgi:hypothetical protein
MQFGKSMKVKTIFHCSSISQGNELMRTEHFLTQSKIIREPLKKGARTVYRKV